METTGSIARQLGLDRDLVSYLIRKGGIIHDFAAWAKKTYPSDAECAEIADEYLADIEARKAAEHNNRAQN